MSAENDFLSQQLEKHIARCLVEGSSRWMTSQHFHEWISSSVNLASPVHKVWFINGFFIPLSSRNNYYFSFLSADHGYYVLWMSILWCSFNVRFSEMEEKSTQSKNKCFFFVVAKLEILSAKRLAVRLGIVREPCSHHQSFIINFESHNTRWVNNQQKSLPSATHFDITPTTPPNDFQFYTRKQKSDFITALSPDI